MITLSIIGCGNAGQTLARLWNDAGVFNITGILNSSIESSRIATAFVGAGTASETIHDLTTSDVYLIGCPDDSIRTCCEQLATSCKLTSNSIVFHLSGALSSSELAAVKDFGAEIASIHPIKSFAEPSKAIGDFSGTWCGCEGDAVALSILEDAFAAIGGRVFHINADNKTLYHAASVIACNYLVALEEISLQTFEQAGVDRELALQILEPILQGTVSNIISLGTTNSLTGPIARGDSAVIAKQLEALDEWKPGFAEIYRSLGLVTADISGEQGNADGESLEKIRNILLPG
jgi:predicted short-subunit dehydrogenase-like oxidoreductase (DUF2520 family)